MKGESGKHQNANPMPNPSSTILANLGYVYSNILHLAYFLHKKVLDVSWHNSCKEGCSIIYGTVLALLQTTHQAKLGTTLADTGTAPLCRHSSCNSKHHAMPFADRETALLCRHGSCIYANIMDVWCIYCIYANIMLKDWYNYCKGGVVWFLQREFMAIGQTYFSG